MLPMSEPETAAEELARCVEKGFLGALIDNHLEGRFYDDEFFWPVFDKAQKLDVPLYIHPTFSPPALFDHYKGTYAALFEVDCTSDARKGNYSDFTSFIVSTAGWGWHAETALHFLRLFLAGVFDRFPKLKIIFGHMGEMIPFQLDRMNGLSHFWGQHERGLKEIWESNIWVTTSGMFSLTPLACLLRVSPIEKIMYSVDYPFSANQTGKAFVDEIANSGMLTQEQLEMICHKNAETLLGIEAAATA